MRSLHYLNGGTFSPFPAEPEHWCKRNGCVGHYRLREVTFDEFLETYVCLWAPPKARENLKRAVIKGTPFDGRQLNAIKPLRRLRENWTSTLRQVRGYGKCGLCDSDSPPEIFPVNNLYEGKMLSQLFYDALVPFDTKSRVRIKKAGYPDPEETSRQ